MARLGFNSIAKGTLTDDDIEVDVLQNGVSIFEDGYRLKIKAGRTTPAKRYRFATNPMPVTAGDRFTIEVLQADSSAKDGWLDLKIVGG